MHDTCLSRPLVRRGGLLPTLLALACLLPLTVLPARADEFNDHVQAGNAAKKAEDWPTLVRETTALIGALPPDISDVQKAIIYKLRGEGEYHLNDFQAAASDYALSTAYRPEDDSAWMFEADAYEKIGEYSQAVAAYSKVLELKPDDIGALQMRGYVYLEDDKYPGAIAACDAQIAQESNPDLNGFYGDRALLRFRHGDWAGAADDFSGAIRHERWVVNAGYHGEPTPSLARLLARRSAALAAQGQASSGADNLKEALAIAPEDPDVLAARADIALQAKDYTTASTLLEKALAKNADNSNARYTRAQIFFAQGKTAQAKADEARARAISPIFPPLAYPVPAKVKAPGSTGVKPSVKPITAKRKTKP